MIYKLEVSPTVYGQFPPPHPSEEPPRRMTKAGLTSDDEVTEEQPVGDERLLGGAWRTQHDVQVWGVEAQSGGGEAVGDQVDPQQLDRDEGLRHPQSGREEDAEEEQAGAMKLRLSPVS